MTNHFLTLQQAAQMTGKSLPTITRLARKNQHTNHVKKQGNKYLVSMDLISQNYSTTNPNDKTINHDESPGANPSAQAEEAENIKSETITLLKELLNRKEEELNQKNREMERKDVQIQRKDDQIDSLTERIRETNIIIQNLQTRLQIPEKSQENFQDTQIDYQEEPEAAEDKKDYKAVIIDLLAQNYTHRSIAHYLNEHGYLNTQGNSFSKNAVEKIIMRLRKKGLL